ncbi:hypothetical protein ACFWBM_40520 [Streptomyces sp. NPDC059980]|uniref:hypothetical protein n=1 Tax=Streptomyces sp. NPDC059980 TaxID=3347022 RepID=UPI0036862117
MKSQGQYLKGRTRPRRSRRNENAKLFTWTATTDEILAKIRLVQTAVKKLVNNNSK